MPETPNLDELSHAEFDAHFVRTWQPRYPWAQSQLPANAAITPDAFRMHAQQALLAHIRKQKGQSGYQDGRAALEYAAFELVDAAAKVLHLRQRPLMELAERFRRDMLLCLRSNELSTYHAWSPRWGKGTQRPRGSTVSWDEPLTSKWDKLALEHLAGGHVERDSDYVPALDRVGEMLEAVTPRLATLDTASLTIRQQEWRAQMWELLDKGMSMDGSMTIFTPTQRETLLDASLTGLLEELPAVIEEGIDQDVARGEFIARRRQELKAMHINQLNDLVLRRTRMQPMRASTEEKISMILHAELRTFDATGSASLIDNQSNGNMSNAEFVEQVTNRLLSLLLEGPMTPQARRSIAERMRILAYHASVATSDLQAASNGEEGYDADDAMARLTVLQRAFQRAIEMAGIDWQDMPYFAHLKFILASQMDSIDARELRSFL